MKKLKIKIVVANYYKEITDPLTKSCTEILEQSKLKYEILTVPGVYEIPHNFSPDENRIEISIDGSASKDEDYPDMHVLEVEDEVILKTCKIHGYNYTVITPNDIVIPPDIKHDFI